MKNPHRVREGTDKNSGNAAGFILAYLRHRGFMSRPVVYFTFGTHKYIAGNNDDLDR